MTQVASLVPYRIMPAKMGGQKGIYLFLKHLSRYCNITCYTTKHNEPGDEPFTVKRIIGTHKLRYVNPAYFLKLKKEFQKDKITHLLLEQPYYGWLAILLKKSLSIKLILHSHNIEGLRFRSTGKWWWKMMQRYERNVHRNADFNFFVTADDMAYAVQHFDIPKQKCAVITYGTERNQQPDVEERFAARRKIMQMHSIAEDNKLLLYNGSLNYFPNIKGLDYILENINPLLLRDTKQPYHILICGPSLPSSYENLSAYRHQNITYAGFVDDIDLYFKAADVFINPVTEGGGIKTKLVEALAMGCSAVSFANGAIGIPAGITGNKLSIVADHDTQSFAKAIDAALALPVEKIPTAFFEHFYWDNIAASAAKYIEQA